MITKLIHKCLSIFFPVFCFDCGKENYYLCGACKEKIAPNYDNLKIKYCFQVLAASNYNNPVVKKIIWHFKYRGARALADTVADIMLANISLLNSLDKTNCFIIPVPISKKKSRERGYNQSELLARSLSLKTGIAIKTDILFKKLHTRSQVEMKAKETRKLNLKNSFALLNEIVKDKEKTIILLDDIITTGATMEEAAKILKKSGFKKIVAVAAAHG